MRHNPNDVHALVINRILALPRGSPESHAAYADYQYTRVVLIRPKIQAQMVLLNIQLSKNDHEAFVSGLDQKVYALDDEISAAWLALDSRIGTELTQEAA